MVAILRVPGILVLFLLVVFAAPASAQYANTTAITITDCPNPCPASGQAASLYPSPITVSGEVGVVQRVSVTLNGFTHGFPADVDFLLVSPSGRKSVLVSDFGAGAPGVSNITLTLDDYAQRPIPSTVTGNTGVPFVSGTYRPANSNTTDLFPAPAPASPYTYTLSAFNGDSPNGTWNLYIIDDANLDGGLLSGGWEIAFDVRPPAPAAGDILISEFRTRGVGTTPPGSDGAADEFIEIYNNTDNSITIIDSAPGADPTSPSGAGWRFAGAQGAAETTFLVLPQTLSTNGPLAIAPRSYFLISTQPTSPSPAGNTYSLSTYPTGTGITGSGSANVSVNPGSATVGFLPDDVGLAVFSTAGAVPSARLDSVGFSSVTHADYKEGTGLAPPGGIVTPSQHSWTRRLTAGVPQDTGNNAADFLLVATTGNVIDGQAATLGAPGPERGNTITAFTTTGAPSHYPPGAMTSTLIDPLQPKDAAPNQVRDFTPVTNGANGTLKVRRRYTNNSGDALVAFRFRIVALSTRTGGAPPAGEADLRVLNSPTQTITLTDSSSVTSQALTLQTPAAQALGGGVNSSLTVGVITTTAPLANGASVVVEFNLGVETDGPYAFMIRGEGLAADGIGGVNVLDEFSTGADLSITKTDGVVTATPGASVTYTIAASNAGPGNAIGATVADTFPAALSCTWTCVGAGGGSCAASGSGNINSSVNLPAHSSVTYTASCTIAAGATGTLVNTATITPPGGVTDPNLADNTATDTDTLVPSSDLAITKTDGVTTATPGGSVIYTVTASNAGPSHAIGATVADTFPAALSCSWTCVGAGGGSCVASGLGNINSSVNLPAGGSVTYTASCTIAPGAMGTLVNTATVTPPGGVDDPNTANNTATDTDTLAPSADLSIVKTDGMTTATPGSSLTYTITASNAGPSNATGATVVDTFPASLTCSWTCVGAGGGSCAASGSGSINSSVNLPAGGSATYTASCTIASGATGTLVNTATVTAPAGVSDPNPANNSAIDSDTLSVSADVAITKTAAPDPVAAGQLLTYTLTVSNSGPSIAASVVLSDTLPVASTFVHLAAPRGWSCTTPPVGSGGAISCSNASLAAAASDVFTLTTTIVAATPVGTIVTNTATVSASTPDPASGNNAATATVAVTAGGASQRCDVNGDGYPEFVTGAGPAGGPHVRVWQVVGNLVEELTGFFAGDPAFPGGVTVACRDLTGDGSDEVITALGAGSSPEVVIWTLQGNVMVEVTRFFAYHPAWRGGVTVAAGDITGDGISEVITGAGPGGGPHVRAWRVSGSLVEEVTGFFAYDEAFRGGVAVTVGDVTGDGVGEIITGAGPGGGPHVRVWRVSGNIAEEVTGFFAYDPALQGGASVAVGDVTGDGVGEIITGAGPNGGPHVRVWRLTGNVVVEETGFFAYDPAFQGGVFVAAGDVTGDGVAELITGAGLGGGPHVRVWSITSGGIVEVTGFFATHPAFQGGVRVAR